MGRDPGDGGRVSGGSCMVGIGGRPAGSSLKVTDVHKVSRAAHTGARLRPLGARCGGSTVERTIGTLAEHRGEVKPQDGVHPWCGSFEGVLRVRPEFRDLPWGSVGFVGGSGLSPIGIRSEKADATQHWRHFSSEVATRKK